jgi:hypothetical protein
MSGSGDEALGPPSDEEALKLTLSFYCILEPDKRMQVLALAQQLAKESKRVDGHTHFTDLDPAIGAKPKSLN